MSKLALEEIYLRALKAVDPQQAVTAALADRSWKASVTLLAAGKAAVPMALACLQHLGERCSGGVLVTKDGHLPADLETLSQLECFEAAHPVPNEAGLRATQRFLEVARQADGEVLFALSGGASALLVAPIDGLPLERFQQIQQHLLRAGADIEELNTIRKHLSRIKGGRLAEVLAPASCLTVILSDVVGSPLDAIASGPTVADNTTLADFERIAKKYGLELELGQETPKPADPCFANMETRVVADHRHFQQAAVEAAIEAGWAVRQLERPLTQDVSAAAQMLLAELERLPQGHILIGSGETTVRVRGDGLGGRSQQLALEMALGMQGQQDTAFLAGASDGTDGPTDAAGGLVNNNTVILAAAQGLDAADYLQRCDAYHFLEAVGGLLKTGPTGTNVNDLVLLARKARG